MRTIKFRGQRIDNNEWVIGDLCSMFNEKNLCIMPKSFYATRDLGEREDDERIKLDDGFAIGAFYAVKPETVGQFTGCLDKQGREIYEGDIISNNNIRWEVEYFSGAFWLSCDDDNLDIPFNEVEKWNLLEIIGNIYENPELLK